MTNEEYHKILEKVIEITKYVAELEAENKYLKQTIEDQRQALIFAKQNNLYKTDINKI